jgi:plasmid stabilization system protein ParE
MAHRVAPEAETELDEIWSYIAQNSGSSEAARRVIASITQLLGAALIFGAVVRRRKPAATA